MIEDLQTLFSVLSLIGMALFILGALLHIGGIKDKESDKLFQIGIPLFFIGGTANIILFIFLIMR